MQFHGRIMPSCTPLSQCCDCTVVDASNHMGVANLFGQVVVAPGLVEGQWGREIRVLRDLRIDADYQVSAAFSEFDSHETCERAQAFVNRIRPLLAGAVPMDET